MEGAVKEGNTIIYIDEIHNMIGAGRGSDGGPDASNMLKQYLEAGDIRFIGSTTYEEFNRYISRNLPRRRLSESWRACSINTISSTT